MLKIGTLVLLLNGAVFSDGFLFPDQVAFKANSELSGYGEGDDRSNLNSYGDSYAAGEGHRQTFGRHDSHRPAFNEHYNGNRGELTAGFDNNHGENYHRGNRHSQQHYGGIVSQSQANAQSSGFGSHANSQSGSKFFNGGSQSNSEAQAQAQSQGYQAYPAFWPSGGGGGSGASSASSAASATAGIVDGVATASAAAAAASASSANGASSSSSSSSSSTAGGNNGGFGGNGQNPPWFFRTRVAGQDGDVNTGSAAANAASGASASDDKLIFSQK